MKEIPKINDVAKLANVSISTVSRVLNNNPRISDKTKNKVLKIVKQINYEPNNIARGLSKNKTNTIGVILEDIENPFFSKIAKGIEEKLQEMKYTMILVNTNFEKEKEIKFTKLLLRNRVDGVVIAPVNNNSKSLQLLEERGVPFFALNCRAVGENFNWISSNNVKGGYIATKYLLDLGHKKIMHIKGADDQPSTDKYEGFKKAILEKKLLLSDQIIINNKAKNFKDGKEIIIKFLKKNGKDSLPSAIFVTNDDVAIGAMEVLSREGIRIPKDVSIIGYDDISIADYYSISLTTVRQEMYNMGRIAASELISKISSNEENVIKQLLLEPKLIIRSSCIKV